MRFGLAFAFAIFALSSWNPVFGEVPNFSCQDAEWAHHLAKVSVPVAHNGGRNLNSLDIALVYMEGPLGALIMFGALMGALFCLVRAYQSPRKNYVALGVVFALLAAASFTLRCFLATTYIDECIVSGSLINTPDGEKPIDDLSIGEGILSRNDSGSIVESRVKAKKVHSAPNHLRIRMASGRELLVTHPHIVSAEKGWVPACSLRAGDRLSSLEGFDTITDISKVEGTVKVHEIETSPVHNFFANGLLVHNVKE